MGNNGRQRHRLLRDRVFRHADRTRWSSSFSLQTLSLAQDGDWLRVSGNITGSVVLCLAAVWLGHIAAAALSR
jgi:hypothetical protein